MGFQKGNQLGKRNRGKKRSMETIERLRQITLKRYNQGEKFGFQKKHIQFEGIESGWFKKNNIPWNKNLKGFMEGEKNGMWKEDKVGYSALHGWVRRHLGKADRCCFNPEHKSFFEWANVSGEYKRDFNDWVSLCAKCHDNFDRNNKWGKATKKFKFKSYKNAKA